MTEEFSTNNVNLFAAELIILELIKWKVKHFIISPGSRSTPLVMAISKYEKDKDLRVTIAPDERTAAYMSLGYNRSGKRSALVCTSGSAPANYFPAVIEAYETNTPLIILSADRPSELLGTQANQAINQTNLYSNYADFLQFDCADRYLQPEHILSKLDFAMSNRRMPLQINCAFREPFLSDMPFEGVISKKLEDWKLWSEPYTKYPNYKDVNPLDFRSIFLSGKLMFIIGNTENIELNKTIVRYAEKHKIPVYSDIQSGVKTYSSLSQLSISNILENKELMPHYIVQFGTRIVSKSVHQMIKSATDNNAEYIIFCDIKKKIDFQHNASEVIHCNFDHLAEKLSEMNITCDSDYYENLKQYDYSIYEKLKSLIPSNISELNIVNSLNNLLITGSILFLANSLTIRNFDNYSMPIGKIIDVKANRGTSGIDGNVSSAIGYALAQNMPTTLVIGDLSLYHDLNALLLLSELPNAFIIIVVNNNGGGIFRQLPVGKVDEYERYFQTPINLNFRSAAELFSIDYCQPQIMEDFEKVYKAAILDDKKILIEFNIDNEEAYVLKQKINEVLCRN